MTPPTATAVFTAVATRLTQSGSKPLGIGDPLSRHRGFFVRRRATTLTAVTAYANFTLDQFAARIVSEHRTVDQLASDTVDALRAGRDVPPLHLDLNDLAKPKATTPPSVAKRDAAAFKTRRWARIRAILWRAAAIHDEAWTATEGGLGSDLNAAALLELLNRRLRVVERMNYQIGRIDPVMPPWTFTGSGAHGPWKDGYRGRMLELPMITRDPKPAVPKVVGFLGGAASVAPAVGVPAPWKQGDPEWRWDVGQDELLYNVAPLRFGPNMATWSRDPQNADDILWKSSAGGISFSTAIDNMMRPNEDWWQRSWLCPNIMLRMLYLDALSFAVQRRFFTNGVGRKLIDDLPNNNGGSIGTGGPTPFSPIQLQAFQMDQRDLQIGDQVLVWNHEIMPLLVTGRSLSIAIVTDLQSDPQAGSIDRASITLQAPGTREQRYGTFVDTIVVPELNHALDRVHAYIAQNPTATKLDWNGFKDVLIRWDPYETLPGTGAWWVRVTAGSTNTIDAGYLQFIRGMIFLDKIPKAADFKPPSVAADGYVPLSLPRGHDGWPGYFEDRADDADRTPALQWPLQADGTIIGGLFLEGPKDTDLVILRPKFRPS